MRSRFDEQLALLNKEMIEMGALCEEVIALASKGAHGGGSGAGEEGRAARRGDRPEGAQYRVAVPQAPAAAAAGRA